MPKKPAAGSAIATISPEILSKHPLMLTRALDESAAPIVPGQYTIDELRSTFGVEGSQDSVLLELSSRGHAFFRQGETFYSFTPLQDDLNLPIGDEETEAEEPIAEFVTEIIDPDELAEDIEGSVYDPDEEGEPDYSDLVKEEVEELAAAPQAEPVSEPEPAPQAEPAPVSEPEPAIEPQPETVTELEDAVGF